MSRIVAGAVIVLIAIAALFTTCSGPRRATLTPAQIDSLQQRNEYLAGRNSILLAQVATLTIERDNFRRERDSLKLISDSATKQIHRNRAKLPAAEAVPDSMIRVSYAAALQELDRAILELGRKDEIIRRDSLDRIRSDSIEADLRQLLDWTAEQYKNEQIISERWYNAWEEEVTKRRCGRKCGIIIGVAVTVGSAIAIRKVQDVTAPR